MSLYYLNGNKNSNCRINTDGKLFEFLSDNKDVYDDEIHITGETLEAIQDQQPELEQNESVLVGYLDFHLEYNGGYVFQEKLGFEDLIDEITEKHLTGNDLINSDEYDTIMFIRCIENHQDQINDDMVFWNDMDTYSKQFWHIYELYCTSQLDTDNINDKAVKKAISLL